MKPDERSVSRLDLPEFTVQEGGIGAYTGFNSVNLQEICIVRRQAAVRSQIARGWGKPIIVRLPEGKLLASQYQNLEAQRNPAYPEAREEVALCQSEDEGLSWSRPRLLGIPGRSSQFSALGDGTLILATERRAGSSLYRSADEGKTWQRCEIDWEREAEGDHYFGETSGVVELPEGVLLCGFYMARPGSCDSASHIIRSRDSGSTWEKPRPTLGVQGKMPDLWETPDGRVLMVVGCEGNAKGHEIYSKRERRSFNVLFTSDDGGRKWRRDVELPPLDERTESIPADGPAMVPLGDDRYFAVSQAIERGRDRPGHPVDWDYYFSVQGTMLRPA